MKSEGGGGGFVLPTVRNLLRLVDDRPASLALLIPLGSASNATLRSCVLVQSLSDCFLYGVSDDSENPTLGLLRTIEDDAGEASSRSVVQNMPHRTGF